MRTTTATSSRWCRSYRTVFHGSPKSDSWMTRIGIVRSAAAATDLKYLARAYRMSLQLKRSLIRCRLFVFASESNISRSV